MEIQYFNLNNIIKSSFSIREEPLYMIYCFYFKMVLNGFLVEGSMIGWYIIIMAILLILTFIQLIKSKGLINALVMIIVIGTFTAIGFMIGDVLKSSIAIIIISFIFYIGSLKLTIMMLKMQSGKIKVVRHSLGDGDEGMPYGNFDDDDFEDE